MRIVGIDPGAYGAIALLVDGCLIRVEDMPILRLKKGKTEKAVVDIYSLAPLLREMRPDVAYVEQVGGLPGQSAPAAFNFGRSTGVSEGALAAHEVRIEYVPPAVWKRTLRVNDGKDGARAAAMKLWPKSADSFKRKKDDGRAEAALIAEYAHRREGGSNVFG